MLFRSSGFTLVAQPVQAAQAGVVTVQAIEDREHCQTVATAPLQAARLIDNAALPDRVCGKPRALVHTPTVMLRVDRSRE